jgi:hypothetical protein
MIAPFLDSVAERIAIYVKAISRRIDRVLNFPALWIGCTGIEGSTMRNQSLALGGCGESTSGVGGCHPEFGNPS